MNTSAKAIADRYVSPAGGPLIISHVPESWGAPVAEAAPGHNAPPDPTPYEAIKQEIEDLFLEAKNWADGEPIGDQKQANAVTALLDLIAEAMKRAEAARVEEKRPLDDAAAEIQARYNALIGKTKSVTGRAVMAKEALQGLLTPWRTKVETEKRAEAARLAKEAADAEAAAQAAMQASRGNLEEREKAEGLFQAAQDIAAVAKRADKAATTKTGLRSVWAAKMVDEGAALDWAYGYAPEQFTALVQSIADKAVFGGMRKIPGFKVWEDRVAR